MHEAGLCRRRPRSATPGVRCPSLTLSLSTDALTPKALNYMLLSQSETVRPRAQKNSSQLCSLASLGFCKQNENGAAAKTADLATYNAALSAALRLAEGPWERSIQKGS